MELNHLPVNWFDLMVVIVLIVGLSRGRKHGMSEELMVTTQWVAILAAGAFLYRPCGDMLAKSSPVSHLFCYIAIYVTAAVVTKLIFSMIKKALGGKLVGSNVFGGAEYYLGMIAGAIRWGCMLIAALAILNAPYYSPQEISAKRAYDNDLYGSDFFPDLPSIQEQVFKNSLLGSLIKKRAGILLIASTQRETVAVSRAKEVTFP
jgi:uncharacterized membrane protein required for colicin V production